MGRKKILPRFPGRSWRDCKYCGLPCNWHTDDLTTPDGRWTYARVHTFCFQRAMGIGQVRPIKRRDKRRQTKPGRIR